MRYYFYLLTFFCISLTLTGCSEGTYQYNIGNNIGEDILSQVSVNETRKNSVISLMGAPSFKGTFDDNTWYYVYDYKTAFAFKRAKLRKRQIVVLQFKNNKVSEIITKTKEQSRNIAFDNDVTNTGNFTKTGFFTKVFRGSHVGY